MSLIANAFSPLWCNWHFLKNRRIYDAVSHNACLNIAISWFHDRTVFKWLFSWVHSKVYLLLLYYHFSWIIACSSCFLKSLAQCFLLLVFSLGFLLGCFFWRILVLKLIYIMSMLGNLSPFKMQVIVLINACLFVRVSVSVYSLYVLNTWSVVLKSMCENYVNLLLKIYWQIAYLNAIQDLRDLSFFLLQNSLQLNVHIFSFV